MPERAYCLTIIISPSACKSQRPVILLAKCEGAALLGQLRRGNQFDMPVPISAAHGEGLVDLHDAILDKADMLGLTAMLFGEEDADEDDDDAGSAVSASEDGFELDEDGVITFEDERDDITFEEEEVGPISLAIIGRPNMGKSTLINTLIKEDRLLTGPEAGITRDAISLPFSYRGQDYKLVDTAGIRRQARVVDNVERLMGGMNGHSICASLRPNA